VLLLGEIFETIRQAVQSELSSRGQRRTAAEVDAITRAALKWQDLKTDPNTDITLDPQQAVSFEGDTGVYQLYTYARLKSILRKATPSSTTPDLDAAQLTQAEQNLLTSAYGIYEDVRLAAEYMNVSPLVNKLGDLTRSINAWYESNNVLGAASPRQEVLTALVSYVADALSGGLGVVGIDTVEEL
jgi:arginyl-tRNA synthetase